jgi:hypothetical protein
LPEAYGIRILRLVEQRRGTTGPEQGLRSAILGGALALLQAAGAAAQDTGAPGGPEESWPLRIVQAQDEPGGSLFGTTLALWERRHEGSEEERALLLDFLGTDLVFCGAHDRHREVDAERLAGIFPDGRKYAPVDEELAARLETGPRSRRSSRPPRARAC